MSNRPLYIGDTNSKWIYIIVVLDGIVNEVDFDGISAENMDYILEEPPYRDGVNYGNPVARLMRRKDHILKRGWDGDFHTPVSTVDIVCVDNKLPPEFYCYKSYANGVFGPNPNMTEAERIMEANKYMSFNPIACGIDTREGTLHRARGLTYDIVKDYMSEELYLYTVAMKRSHENFTKEERAMYQEIVNRMPEELATKMKYSFATTINANILGPLTGLTHEDFIRDPEFFRSSKYEFFTIPEQVAMTEEVFYWWDQLMGTWLENHAISQKATFFLKTEREDEAVLLYKSMLLKTDLTEELRQDIETRINTIGWGSNIYKLAKENYDTGRIVDAALLLRKFFQEASGWAKNTRTMSAMKMRIEALRRIGDN